MERARGARARSERGDGDGSPIAEMRASLREYWATREPYQTFLYAIGAIMVLSGVFHTAVFLIAGGSWEGPVSWRKPILFGYSFGVTAWALSWVLTFLPRRRAIGWLLLGSFGFCSTAEVALIDMQRWRGVPSHFNLFTPFDSAVFSAMGIVVGVVATDIVLITIWSFVSLRTAPSLALAIRAGLVLLVIGQVLGGLIIATGVQQTIPQIVAQTESSTSVFGPNGVIFGATGIMKIPHGIALHAFQVLPILAWFLGFTDWTESKRTTIIAVASLGYAGLVAVEAYQTFSGLAPFDLDLVVFLVLVASIAALIGCYATGLIGVSRRRLA